MDETDDDILYLGGHSENGPLLAKYSTNTMKYNWFYSFQIEDGTAQTVWNLAQTS